ncbi:MAG: hypothetical protein JNK58_02435, partial [Phycisphaerae bacterium]|nr:hypothetical protein [Phycisphaerae bacterium]
MFPRMRTAVIVGAAVLAGMAGCQRSKIAQTLDTTINTKTESSDLDFWHQLPGRSAVTNSEGLHGVLLLADGSDPTTSWEERLALLKERGWVSESFAQAGDETIDRGTLAKALCHALDIKGGVMMQLTGKMPRYALRELTYLRVMAASTENQIVNGLDYIGIMSKAQDYAMLQETKKAKSSGGNAPAQPAPNAEPAPAETAP